MVNSKQKINHFVDLETWKINHQLTKEIYNITKKFPQEEKFGIADQLRRASSSITANIAEAYGRFHYKDKIRFYYQARGSNAEVQNFLILSFELGLINEKEFNELKILCFQGYKLLGGLIRSTEKRS